MSKDIKKALEHCIEWNCDDCPNREELGSGKTVCRGRLLPYVLEYVSDLEAKLAESEADKKALICDYESRITKEQELMSWLEHNNEQLKQQLAEKKAEIEKWKSMDERSSNLLDRYNRTGEIEDQDKISFVVAELEKAKIEFETYYADNIWNYPQYLEDRIKLLKEEK